MKAYICWITFWPPLIAGTGFSFLAIVEHGAEALGDAGLALSCFGLCVLNILWLRQRKDAL